MNRKELYFKTVNKLLDAYNTEELEHGRCTACAVGNICDGNPMWAYFFATDFEGYTAIESVSLLSNLEFKPYWEDFFKEKGILMDKDWRLHLYRKEYETDIKEYARRKGLETIEKSGYTMGELKKIEYAFETAEKFHFSGDRPKGILYDLHYKAVDSKDPRWMFTGLTAVLNVLKEIHEVDLEIAKENQTKLTEIYEAICA